MERKKTQSFYFKIFSKNPSWKKDLYFKYLKINNLNWFYEATQYAYLISRGVIPKTKAT